DTACAFGGERGGQASAFDQNYGAELCWNSLLAKNRFDDRPQVVHSLDCNLKSSKRSHLRIRFVVSHFVSGFHPWLLSKCRGQRSIRRIIDGLVDRHENIPFWIARCLARGRSADERDRQKQYNEYGSPRHAPAPVPAEPARWACFFSA